MRKASRILLIIGGILSCISVILTLIFGIYCIYLSSPEGKDMLVEIAGGQDYGGMTLEQLQAFMASFGIMLMFGTIFSILCAVSNFVAISRNKKVMYILSIVFGALSGTIVSVLGGIFA